MTRLMKRIGAIGVAAACLAAMQASAADMDGVIFADDANFLGKPAELGSGWYLRGDVYYNVAKEQRQGYIFDEDTGETTDFAFGDGFGYSVGMGYRFNNWFRMDTTLDRPVASETTYSGPNSFGGSREVDYSYFDGSETITITRSLFFDSDGNVTGSECTAQEQTDGWCSVPATTSPIDGARLDELGYSVWTVMANAYVDLPTVQRFTPYAGAGIGLSRANAWYKLTVDCVADSDEACGYPAGSTGEVLNDVVLVDNTFTKWLPTWSVQAGVSYAVTDNLDIDLGYKYMRIMNVASVMEGSGFTMAKKDLDMHQVRLGLRYSIW